MVNKIYCREVTVCRNDLCTVGLVTGFDDDVRSNVESYKTMFIRFTHIPSQATACIGQTLLTFWSHTEQSWMFALIVAALKITYLVLHLYCL